MLIAALLSAIRALINFRIAWSSNSGIDFPAGIIIALAADLTRGIFYRPLFGPDGYGGTRYFPLYFSLHALFLKSGVPVLIGAYVLSAAAMLSLIAAIFSLLARMGVQRWLAAACALALLTSSCAQYAVVSPRADALACSLSIWGLVVLAGSNIRSRNILVSGILFALAWSAKFTAVFGPTSAVIWLISTHRKKMACYLTGATAIGYALVAGIIDIASHGRIVGILKDCAAGDTTWRSLANSPLRIEWLTYYRDFNVFLLIFFALIIMAGDLIEPPLKLPKTLPAVIFLVTIPITVVTYASLGANLNHLLEIQTAALVFVGSCAIRPARLQRRLAIWALALATLVPVGRTAIAMIRSHAEGTPAESDTLRQVTAFLEPSKNPILSENAAIPVLTGQIPYVVDPWMVRVVEQHVPGFREPLFLGLRNQAFGAVVLDEDPETAEGRAWYNRANFGPGFTTVLTENYRRLLALDGKFVYVPIGRPARPGQGK